MNAPIDISSITLKTPRLTLRPWRQSDLEDFYEYASVDGVGQMAGWLPHESREKTQMILDGFITGKKTFALEYQGKVIGSLGIEYYTEEKHPEFAKLQGRSLGYVLSKDYWEQGLMPEAMKAVLEYLFGTVGLDFLTISHFTWNDRSRRVIEKSGFRLLGTDIHETRYGTKEPVMYYILYRKDWLQC